MSTSENETLQLGSRKDFRAQARLEDPETGLVYQYPLEIDTGNPDAISLPRTHAYKFNEYVGDVARSGAGTGQSECYSVKIQRLGTMELDFETIAVMTLSNRSDYGLIGIDLLKMMSVEIYDEPEEKKMTLSADYL